MSPPRWLAHFGLSRPPFNKEVGDAELWVPSSRKRVVDRLVDACHERGHELLTGEPGVGKTCVLRAVRHRLPTDGFRLTYCHNATLGRRDFYRQLCFALGLSPKATAAAVFYAINQHVRELGDTRVHPVFLLDEVHLLHQDVLDHLHILTNYEWDSAALLSLVLVGLPEMDDRPHASVSRRGDRGRHRRVHRAPAQARRLRARDLHVGRDHAAPRSRERTPPRPRPPRDRRAQARRAPQGSQGRPPDRRGRPRRRRRRLSPAAHTPMAIATVTAARHARWPSSSVSSSSRSRSSSWRLSRWTSSSLRGNTQAHVSFEERVPWCACDDSLPRYRGKGIEKIG